MFISRFDTNKIKGMIISKGIEIGHFYKNIKMNHSTFYNLINNKTDPKFENVCKIAIALDCKIDDLLQKEVN